MRATSTCNSLELRTPFRAPFLNTLKIVECSLANLYLRFYGIFVILGAKPELQRPIERLPPPFPPPFFEHSEGCGMPLANLYLRFPGTFAIWGTARTSETN